VLEELPTPLERIRRLFDLRMSQCTNELAFDQMEVDHCVNNLYVCIYVCLCAYDQCVFVCVCVSRALTLKGSRNPLLTLAFVVGPHLHERKGYSGLWGNLGSSRVSWNDDSAVH